VSDHDARVAAPGFWRWLFMGRAKQDAYCAAVFERRGFTPDEARRATMEFRAASRGIPLSPWLKQRIEETSDAAA